MAECLEKQIYEQLYAAIVEDDSERIQTILPCIKALNILFSCKVSDMHASIISFHSEDDEDGQSSKSFGSSSSHTTGETEAEHEDLDASGQEQQLHPSASAAIQVGDADHNRDQDANSLCMGEVNIADDIRDAKHIKRTPLTLAVVSRSIKSLQVMLKYLQKALNDTCINTTDGWGETPLCVAIQEHQHQCVNMLLEYGASATRVARGLMSPLHYCARNGDINSATLLLQYGAHTDGIDINLETPIFLSVRHDHVDFTKFLLEHTQNSNIAMNNKGMYPIHYIQSVECAEILLQAGMDQDRNGEGPTSALIQSVKANKPDLVRFLLNNGYDINTWDTVTEKSTGKTTQNASVHWAAILGFKEVYDVLYEFGSDVNTLNSNQTTPLMMMAIRPVASKEHLDLAMQLAKSCDVNLVNDKGQTALHLATKYENLSMVHVLCQRLTTNINQQDKRGYTPLMYACMLSCTDVVLYYKMKTDLTPEYTIWQLLRANCHLHLKQVHRRTAIQLAVPDPTICGPKISQPIMKMLVMMGSPIPSKRSLMPWLKKQVDPSDKYSSALQHLQSVLQWMISYKKHCPTLQHLCRLTIRRALGKGNTLHNATLLPIPVKLINYLLLEDFECDIVNSASVIEPNFA